MNTILSHTEPIARKEHKCTLCYEKINVGNKYYKDIIAADDTVYEIKTCEKCKKLINYFDKFYTNFDSSDFDQEDYESIVDDYIRDHHFICDEATNEWIIDKDWQVSFQKQVEMIYNELSIK